MCVVQAESIRGHARCASAHPRGKSSTDAQRFMLKMQSECLLMHWNSDSTCGRTGGGGSKGIRCNSRRPSVLLAADAAGGKASYSKTPRESFLQPIVRFVLHREDVRLWRPESGLSAAHMKVTLDPGHPPKYQVSAVTLYPQSGPLSHPF